MFLRVVLIPFFSCNVQADSILYVYFFLSDMWSIGASIISPIAYRHLPWQAASSLGRYVSAKGDPANRDSEGAKATSTAGGASRYLYVRIINTRGHSQSPKCPSWCWTSNISSRQPGSQHSTFISYRYCWKQLYYSLPGAVELVCDPAGYDYVLISDVVPAQYMWCAYT